MNALNRLPADLLDEIAAAADKVVRSGWYALGPSVKAFEAAFADYCGVKHMIGVGNGTDALEVAMRAVGCGQGDRVAMVANAGMYAATAAYCAGARPLFVDVSPDTQTMSPDSLEAVWSPDIKAVVATHLYGRLCDMDAILAIAKAKGVPVVEDCAQAHGATRGNRKAGAFGDIAAFSFYPTKNLGAFGDGGAIATSNDALAETILKLRQYGWSQRYSADIPGGRNSRLDEIQAAILSVLLPHLDGWNARRREIATRITAAAEGKDALRLPPAPGEDDVCHLLVATSPERDRVRETLKAADVATDIHYPIPDHRQAALAGRPETDVSLPVTEQLSETIVSLPCFPTMTDDEVARLESAVASL